MDILKQLPAVDITVSDLALKCVDNPRLATICRKVFQEIEHISYRNLRRKEAQDARRSDDGR